jgi:two-component system sensor histidine kinase QseC
MSQRTAYSIDRRVFRGSLLALILGLTLSSVLSYWSTRHEVGELFDAQLIENARFIKGIANQKATADDWQTLQRALQETVDEQNNAQHPILAGHAYEKKLAVQIWSKDGALIVRSPSAPRHALAPLHTGLTTFDGDQDDWKVYTIWLDQNQHWLVVAERSDIRGELTKNIEASLLLGILVGLGLATWWLRRELKSALRPLMLLGKTIATRHMDDLQPVQIDPTPQELQPVVDELNALFDRVAQSIERERAFLADAAHELRTPLAVVKLQVEQALAQPSQQAVILQKLMHSVERNQQVVEQMLLLARIDRQDSAVHFAKVALDQLLREVVAQLIPLALKRDIELEVDNKQPVYIQGDAALLVAMIRNLIDNAMRHSPDGSVIHINLSHSNATQLIVHDAGQGIDPQWIGEVTERFKQGSRADGGGSGLGLAIVQAIAKRHGATLSLQNHPRGGLQAMVQWP